MKLLIEELRAIEASTNPVPWTRKIAGKAADEIERLTALLADLRRQDISTAPKDGTAVGSTAVERPAEGSLWVHHSGREYRVLFVVNDAPEPKPDYPVCVVYHGVSDGRRWAGRLDDWHRRMTKVTNPQPKE